MRPCFNFTASANKTPVLSLMDEIGFWGMQSKDFRDQLSKVEGDSLIVEIDSPGGDVFAGLAMYNMLKNSGKTITTRVAGVAASAASIVAMAGDEIEMPANTFMMVHNPWGVVVGNADDMREQADVLDKIGNSLTNTYVARTGRSEDEIKAMLAKDTWLTADECLEQGFCTKITDKIEAQAKFDMDRADLPENVRAVYAARRQANPPAPAASTVMPPADLAEELTALCKTSGLEAYAAQFIVAADSLETGKALVKNAEQIVALCKLANRPQDARAAIRENKSIADVRASLVKAMAAADVHTDTTQPAEKTPVASNLKPATQVYQERAERKAARRNSHRK